MNESGRKWQYVPTVHNFYTHSRPIPSCGFLPQSWQIRLNVLAFPDSVVAFAMGNSPETVGTSVRSALASHSGIALAVAVLLILAQTVAA
jgi:hypothetical protein